MNYKTYDYDGYKIFTIKTDKFKNCYMEVTFREDARKVNVTKRNALVSLLTYTSEAYPTKREMLIKSEELYNVSFGGSISRSGYNLLSSFGIDFLNPKFVSEKNYLEDTISFLFECLTHPHVKEEKFNERSFNIIKERMKTNIMHYKEKPFSYALVESKKALFGDSITGVQLNGNLNDLEEITPENLYPEYQKLLDSHCDILIIGDLDMERLAKIIQKHFYKPSIAIGEIPFIVENKIQKYHELEVESVYQQTQLLLYYQWENITEKERNFVSPLFTRILGNASMEDKLYKSLRMENSLCYNCGTTGSLADGYSILFARLSYKNIPLALEKMRQCMKEMVEGHINPTFFEIQKEKILADLKLREDNMYGLIDNYYFHEIVGQATFEEFRTEIPKITIEDIQEFARKFHESFLYILKERNNDGEN